MKGKFVCFFGIDGSGKTTLINESIKRLNQKGVKFNYVWGSHQLYFLRPIIVLGKRILFRNSSSSKDYNRYVSSINKIGKSSFLSLCYQGAIFIEYLVQIFFKISIPLLIGKNIISDRYIYDTVVNMKVNLGLEESTLNKIIKVLLKIIPAPDLIFFVDVPEELAFARKTDTPSIEYLRIRRILFKKIAESYHAIFIDGTKSIEELYSLIEESIQSNLEIKSNGFKTVYS